MSLKPYLKRLMEERATLSRDEARALMETVFSGGSSEIELAALFGALGSRAEDPAELAGFVDAMRSAATTLPLTGAERDTLVDTCGTGGDLSGTFNISTAAALVAAAAGASVAKHGNRAVTSKSGSADVLEALGIPVSLTPPRAAEALRRHRFAFLHAPGHHPAMRAVMPVRRALGIRTVFHVLGPLTNPAGARAQVMGVYSPHLVPIVAEAMVLLGTRHAFVVHGESGDGTGMDEISIGGPSSIAEVRDGKVILSTFAPEDAGLKRALPGQLHGGDATANAQILRSIFAGEPGPHRDVVLLNAAAVLVTAGLAGDLLSGVSLARQAIDNGSVSRLITELSLVPQI
ncbi:Anthranilate phosphoribosyltransferase [Granulicella sibirica]|uniref:Anthranilate phosphoribosyltransferase n=2 Tax=Granulicella sibirica TaxID=2479048 RepID=A0A4Q0T0E1_9BACT|nr:anthranilate phosphoribosyltransferase [Granulicella sibirica]RXH54846.1 Anthranilate phosphoribosyltransferase [Granulicella sibirica]